MPNGANKSNEAYLNETYKTITTNYNDLPVKTCDFKASLGEFEQTYPHYHTLRKLHLFMHDFGELLAPMAAVYTDYAVFDKRDDSDCAGPTARWTASPFCL